MFPITSDGLLSRQGGFLKGVKSGELGKARKRGTSLKELVSFQNNWILLFCFQGVSLMSDKVSHIYTKVP